MKRRSCFLFFLYLVLQAANGDALAGEMTNSEICLSMLGPKRVLDEKFVKSFHTLKRLKRKILEYNSTLESNLLTEWPWRTKAELENLSKRFSHPGTSYVLRIELGIDPKLRRKAIPHAILFGSIYENANSETPIGYFDCLMKRFNREPFLSVEYLGLFVDQTIHSRGFLNISKSIERFMRKNIYQVVPIKKEILMANYGGRLIWAKYGITLKENHFQYRGQKLSAFQMAIQNFGRFLKLHNITIEELVIARPNQIPKPISHLEEFSDLAYVVHSLGEKIHIAPLFGTNSKNENIYNPPKDLNIGEAFLLSDNSPSGDDFITSGTGPYIKRYSASSMPAYHGYRMVE